MTGVNEQDERLPEALVDELKRIDRAPEVITSRVDRTLASMAHVQFAQRRIPRWQPQSAWRVAAAACVLVVVLFSTDYLWEQDDRSIYADIDAPGVRAKPGVRVKSPRTVPSATTVMILL